MSKLNLEEITQELKSSLNLSYVVLTDDSHLHKTHQQFQSEKAYISIYINEPVKLTRLALHRNVMKIVEKTCAIPVHAIAVKYTDPRK